MRALHRPLLIFVLHVVKHPRRVLTISLIIVALCAGLAKWKLSIATEQNKLFDQNIPFFKEWISFTNRFPENEATYILIESKDPNQTPPLQRWTSLADAIADRLKQLPGQVKSVDVR